MDYPSREAAQLVRDQGGIPVERSSAHVDCIVVGAEQLPLDAARIDPSRINAILAADGVLENYRRIRVLAAIGPARNAASNQTALHSGNVAIC